MKEKMLGRIDDSVFVLVACECSQVVTCQFRRRGAIAFSCDIQPSFGGHPDWHIIGDCLPYLSGVCEFVTESGVCVCVPRWDLIIAHPPCTYLSTVQSHLIFSGRGASHVVIDRERYSLMKHASDFFKKCLNAQCQYLVVENPQIMLKETGIRRPDDCVSPHEWGSMYSKRTWLWLRGLPPLIKGVFNSRAESWVYSVRGSKARSRFFVEVAAAMANQYLPIISNNLK